MELATDENAILDEPFSESNKKLVLTNKRPLVQNCKKTEVLNVSLICASYGDYRFLPLTIPRIIALHPAELVFVVNFSDDKTVDILRDLISVYRYIGNVKIIRVKKNKPEDWAFSIAYVKRVGFDFANCDNILVVDSDTILNPKVADYIKNLSKFAHISFLHDCYPISFRRCLLRLYLNLGMIKAHLGNVNMFTKQAYLECEEVESIKRAFRGEDVHLMRAIAQKYPVKCVVNVPSIHLKEREDYNHQFIRGVYYCSQGIGFLNTLLTGLMFFRFAFIKGYIKERFGLAKF